MKTNSLFACSISFLFLIDLSNIKKKEEEEEEEEKRRERKNLYAIC